MFGALARAALSCRGSTCQEHALAFWSMCLQRARRISPRQSDWSLLVCQGVPRPAQIDFYRRSGASIDDLRQRQLWRPLARPRESEVSGTPRHHSDVLGRDTDRFRQLGLEMRRAPPAEMHKSRRHRAKQPTLREHLADGVDRRPDLAQHLQDARGIVPPLQRVLELPEVKHHIPQVIRSRLLARSAS